MKILTLVAAAAAVVLTIPAASAAPVAAPGAVSVASFAANAPAAQDGRRWSRTERRYERRTHNRRAYYRTVCTRKWRHGHRIRDCRKVRYYR